MQWKELVESDEGELQYQEFLSEHAGMFFGMDGTCLVISQLQLGTELRPDLVVAHDCRSGGIIYEFIELKKPSDQLFTKGGLRSEPLRKAEKQIEDWQMRLQDGGRELELRLPPSRAADRRCSFTIIIGRREDTKDGHSSRNRLSERMSKNHRVNIRSYQYLTDELARRQFAPSCSPHWVHGSEPMLNQLANPFTRAFTDKSWRSLLQDVKQATSDGLAVCGLHFLACAGEHVVKRQKYNRLFEEFVRRQSQL